MGQDSSKGAEVRDVMAKAFKVRKWRTEKVAVRVLEGDEVPSGRTAVQRASAQVLRRGSGSSRRGELTRRNSFFFVAGRVAANSAAAGAQRVAG